MRAAWILRQEYGYTTRILNMHTLKPIDREAIVRAALRNRRHCHCGRASDRRAGRTGELGDHGEPAAIWAPVHHRGHRRQRPLWRIRSAVGAGEGTGSERGAHRPQSARPAHPAGAPSAQPHPRRSLIATTSLPAQKERAAEAAPLLNVVIRFRNSLKFAV